MRQCPGRMSNLITTVFQRFVPPHFHNPFALAVRLILSRERAAWFNMAAVFLGLIFTPIDLLLHFVEKRWYKRTAKPKLPLIFVCGAPRSGTTLVAQVIIKHLPVTYISNLTAVFPRSPILANLLAEKLIGKQRITYQSYYGKTTNFSGPNEGFYVWNQWMQADPSGVRCVLMDSKREEMIRFFGAYEQAFHRPLVNKNNSLNMCAASIAALLDNAYFICLTRDPSYLAQSLIRARIELQGRPDIGLWVDRPNKPQKGDYVEDVCEQVLFHEEKMMEQQQVIGPERFWIISYEEFCRAPHELVKKVSEDILKQPFNAEQMASSLKPFDTTNRIKQPEVFKKIEESFVRLRAERATLTEE
jgi:hypothetical protein